jgi:6-phosphogluconolactonase
LTPVTGSPFLAGEFSGDFTFSVTVDPSGKFAYVGNYSSNSISAFTINTNTGALTAISGSPFAAGASPQSVTVDSSGKFAYVANFNSNDVSAFTINASSGALTPVGSPVPTAGVSPYSVVTTGKIQ